MKITKDSPSLTCCAVGDIALCDSVENNIDNYGVDFPFMNINKIMQGHDIIFCNLESVFTNEKKGKEGQAHLLKSRPKNIFAIADAGFNVVSIANNHIMDYNETGLQDTISALNACQIAFVGAGSCLEQARKPIIIDKNGISIGILAYAMNGVQSAGAEKPGAAIINYEQIAEDITNLKSKKPDHIIVSLHAGLEFIDYPHPDHRNLCKKIASLGVSLIIGHHPHVIHGVEKIGECLVAHSLGNFVFDPTNLDYKTDRSQQGLMLICIFDKKCILNFETVPIVINRDFQPIIASDGLRNVIANRLKKISEELSSDIYPDIYFKQASELWPKINIAVNFSIFKKQGIWAILKRIPRIKSIYIVLLAKYLINKFKKILIN